MSPYLSPEPQLMGKIAFALKDSKSIAPTAIQLLYTCSDGRLKYYAGQSIHPDQWKPESQLTENKGVNAVLRRITGAIEQFEVDSRIGGRQITREALRELLDKLLSKKTRYKPEDLFSKMEGVIDRMQAGLILTPKEKRYSTLTIKNLRHAISLLREFEPGMTVNNVDLGTYSRFITWCQQKNYSTNYIGTLINRWKTLARHIGGNPVFYSKEFKKIWEDNFDVYLSEAEIKKLWDLKLDSRMTVSRDWFILDCFTGLRVSDLVLLTKKNYNNGFITIANEKTDDKVVIPVHKYVRMILGRYKGFPPVVTDVEINRVIKQVAKKAGIKDKILYSITKGGRRQDHYLEKWEMISCHTARRSFITNLRKNGVADSIVMKLTGIRSFSTLKRYDKISPDEAARIAREHDFFK